MNKKKLNLKNIFNFVKINILIALALSIIVPKVYAKPIPPGSGEGDVPANILFLLDSSLSMDAPIDGGYYLGLNGVDWAVELSDGNIIAAEPGRGVVKILTADNKLDTTFARNKQNFRGYTNDADCSGAGGTIRDSRVHSTVSGDISSNGTIWFGSPTGGKIVAIDSTGKCVGVIQQSKHGIAFPKYLEIRNIGGDDILFAMGRTYKPGGGQVGAMFVMNIGSGSTINGVSKKCNVVGTHQLGHTTKRDKAISMTVSKNGTYFHFSRANKIFSFKTQNHGNNLFCPINYPGTKSISILNSDNGRIENI